MNPDLSVENDRTARRWTRGLVAGVVLLPVLLRSAETANTPAPATGILFAAERPDGQTGAGPLPTIFSARAFDYQALRAYPEKVAAVYEAALPGEGRYALWLRYGAKQPATTGFAANDSGRAERVSLPATGEPSWMRLGLLDLAAGTQKIFIFGGVFESDAVWLGAPEAVPPEAVPVVSRPRRVLPPLEHDRKITAHPRWIFETVRVAYAHWEREKPMPLEEWTRTMKEYGATALMALGNVPDIPVAADSGDMAQREKGQSNRDWKPNYDWVKTFVDTAHRQGMRCTIYSEHLSHLDEVLKEHPEWREKNEAGGNFGSQPCFSSPYWDEFIKRMVTLAATGCDGMVMDMLGFGNPAAGCRNPHCLRAFEEKFGVPAPGYIDPKDPVYQRWVDFQSFVREEALLRLTEAVHRVNSEFAVIVNQHRGWHFDLPVRTHLSSRLPDCVDGLLEEIGWEDRHVATLNRPLSFALKDSFQNAYMRSHITTGKGFMWHLTAASPKVELQARNLNMLAHGVVPNPLAGPPLEWRRDLWQDIKEREEAVLGCSALPWLGLVYSENTLAWRYAAMDEDKAARPYVQSLWGAFQVAAEGRFPTDVLNDWQLTPELLERYRVLVLPNAAALSASTVAALREYVRAGGGIVATYETSLCDETALPRPDFGLADVFGVSWSASATAPGVALNLTGSRHVIAQDEALSYMREWRQGAVEPRPDFRLTTGRPEMRLDYAVPKAGATAEGEGKLTLFAPMGALFRPDQLEQAPQGFPAFFARQFGVGRVVYFPADITRSYFMKNSPATQALLTRAIRWAAQDAPPVEIDGNFQIETTCFTKKNTLYVHLLNDAGGFGRGAPPNPESYGYRKNVVPVTGLTVWVNQPVKRVRLLPGNGELPLQREGGRTKVVVPRLELHAALVLENE